MQSRNGRGKQTVEILVCTEICFITLYGYDLCCAGVSCLFVFICLIMYDMMLCMWSLCILEVVDLLLKTSLLGSSRLHYEVFCMLFFLITVLPCFKNALHVGFSFEARYLLWLLIRSIYSCNLFLWSQEYLPLLSCTVM